MKQSEAWVVQVKSDLEAGDKFYHENNPATYCQAIAKYQQTVEKSVKAMAAAVNDLGSDLRITPSHLPTKEIDALLLLRRAIDNSSVNRLTNTFTKYRKAVEGLCRLAPRWPEDGTSFTRNTEYPFRVDGQWSAPAVQGTFTAQEAKDAQSTANVFHKAAIDFVDGVKLRPL